MINISDIKFNFWSILYSYRISKISSFALRRIKQEYKNGCQKAGRFLAIEQVRGRIEEYFSKNEMSELLIEAAVRDENPEAALEVYYYHSEDMPDEELLKILKYSAEKSGEISDIIRRLSAAETQAHGWGGEKQH